MKTLFNLNGSRNLVNPKLLTALVVGIVMGAAAAKAVPSSSSAGAAHNSKSNIPIAISKEEKNIDPSLAEMKEQMQRLEEEVRELRSAMPFPSSPHRLTPWWSAVGGPTIDSFFPNIDLIQSAFEHSWRSTLPKIEAREIGDTVEVRAEVPGVDQKDLELTVTERSVILKGKKEYSADENAGSAKQKSGFETFTQSIQLPAKIQTDKAVAELEKGILKISAPKKNDKATEERKLSIKTE